ncbi:zinc dependent phospholipase C family protein [Pelosinus sp. sgz500959]|uniref:zinc dependent phospholipase C family protein n=1 Tax=Pelosinus sp. sgz500959 TaxID=3242472 RepID=UPI00366A8D10
MYLPNLANSLAVAGAKLVLTAISPFQKLFDPPGITHEFCNYQAIAILQNDGFELYAQILTRYITELNAGVYWADKGWRNVSHYFEPLSGKGLWQFTTATEAFNGYYQQAINNMHRGNYHQAIFLLGVSAHLLQDLCVPHHARAKVFSGHKEYESWVQQHYTNYAIADKGIYNDDSDLKTQLMNNALVAADLFDWINLDKGKMDYHEATSILLPLAQRSTAGLFLNFFIALGDIIHPPLTKTLSNNVGQRKKWKIAFHCSD